MSCSRTKSRNCCILPHCESSTLGTCENPFEEVHAKVIFCNQIQCKHHPHQLSHHGPQGFTGFQGRDGTKGDHGAPGPRGWQGAVGKGAQGKIGAQGFQGRRGKCGRKGPQGSQGLEGAGTQGDTGAQGVSGFNGFNGMQGVTGPQGPGNSGGGGSMGPQGFTGVPGFDGSQGINGVQGPAGIQGNSGTQGNTGGNGSQGQTGIAGPQGAAGPGGGGSGGAQGPQGLQGLQGDFGGPQGNAGPTGVQGDLGSQGSQGVAGLSGPQGSAGSGGGAQGPQGFAIIGPQGLNGPQGSAGGGGGGSGTQLLFGTDPQQSISPGDVLVNTTTGDFLELVAHGKMNWTRVLDETKSGNVQFPGTCINDNLSFIGAIEQFVTLGQSKLIKSLNQGSSFSDMNTANKNWTGIACGTSALSTVVVASASADTLYVSVDSGGSFISRGPIANWRSVCASSSGQFLYASANGNTLFRSQDNGTSWTGVGPTDNFAKICCNAGGDIVFANSPTQMVLSTNFGATFSQVGPSFTNLGSVSMSADGGVLFGVLDDGTMYKSTNAGVTFTIVDTGVMDVQMSQDQTKVLIVNTDSSTRYSQDGGATFNTTLLPLSALGQVAVARRPLVMTTDGLFALVASINGNNPSIYFGAASPANVIVFNSTVSNQAITSKLLTGLTAVGGRLNGADSILSAFGKQLSAEQFPLGISIHCVEGTSASILCPQNVLVPVVFPGGSGSFVLGDLKNGFDADLDTGIITYTSEVQKTFTVTIDFAALCSTSNAVLFFRATNDLFPGGRITLANSWQQGTIKRRITIPPQSNQTTTIQLYCIQKTSAIPITVQFAAVHLNVSAA